MVSVTGEIDMVTRPVLQRGLSEALEQPGGDIAVVDLCGVTFFGSPL